MSKLIFTWNGKVAYHFLITFRRISIFFREELSIVGRQIKVDKYIRLFLTLIYPDLIDNLWI